MRGFFGAASIALLTVLSLATLPFISESSPHRHSPFTVGDGIIFATLSAFVTLYGAAWWTVRKGKAWARGWAIAASLATVLFCVPPLILSVQRPVIVISLLFMALGIAGVIAFAPRDAIAQNPSPKVKRTRIPGDGTSRLLDTFALLLAIAGGVAGAHWWVRWRIAMGLAFHSLALSFLEIGVALLLSIAIHECGHAVAALALGMKLDAFIFGPFHWRILDGKWKFEFLPAELQLFRGAVGVVSSNPQQSRWHSICVYAAGPLANLLGGLVVMWLVLATKDRAYEKYWEVPAPFATFCLISFAVGLIPSQFSAKHETRYSDAARIYQLLRGGPWADLHGVFSIVDSTLVTPLRPRDYDIQAIQRTARAFTSGRQGLLLRLIASNYFLDCGMIPEACEALDEAEAIYMESASGISAELHTTFVFDNALLRRDPANARKWWERMKSKKPTHFGVDYLLAQSSLLWIENHPKEAREVWNKGNILAQQLPSAGAYEFDRYRYSLLRQVLDETPAASN
jgi:hypothetical protein